MRFNLTRKVFGFLVLGVFSLVSCQNEVLQLETPVEKPHIVGIYAGDVTTRTEMLSDGLSATWVSGDVVSLWAKNSSGTFTLSNQQFKTYGIESELGYFTTELSYPMPEGTYTYYCSYPKPKSVNGTKVTFSIPTVQNGKASDGVDIMVSDPVQGPELNSINDENPYNKVSLSMNRMTHHLRFWIPKGENRLGEDINKIEITMPENIVGTLYTDLTKPTEYKDLGNGSKTLTLELDTPLTESEFAQSQFAYAVIYPSGTTFGSSDYMNITVYGNSGKSTLDPIPLAGRSFNAGHSTPVRLLPKEPLIYSSIRIKTGMNYIGEPLWNIKISANGKTLFNYANTSSAYHNIDYLQEYNGKSGKDSFDAIVNAINNGTATLNFETAHASVDLPLTKSMMVLNGNYAELNLGDVPYLLYEDFNTSKGAEADDAYASGITDADQSVRGYLLNDYLSTTGWNAARYKIFEEDYARINCRYESGAWVVRRYCGRLDTPALKYLKSGTTANIVIEYDKAMYIPTGYKVEDRSSSSARYKVGYHTKAEGSAIDGVNSDKVNSNATIIYTSPTFSSENVGNMTTVSHTIESVGPSTRIVFFADTSYDKKAIAANACYYLCLDNIKVYIKN